ncbi:ABC transporter ATP-binding protein [Candidatus Sumerlaeota bacterium]|nr:ABC transporter ATP-binding protein [Candidatus Sumerlaeota bacterium]
MSEIPSSRPNGSNRNGRPAAAPTIRLSNVARWYGEVLGVNKVTVDIHPGITGLVGPNGSGKSTLMNMICGLLRPGQGTVTVLGKRVWNNAPLRRRVGYCTQVDHFYESFTGFQFLETLLRLHGRPRAWARRTALDALERVGLAEDRGRRLRAYSKGMRQRVKIALALAHQPEILVLDEPFNGLDPVGRHEMMQLFSSYARENRTLLISSHILHEIELMTNRVLMMSNGYVMAEGAVSEVRDQLRRHPFRVFIRCDRPRHLAAILLERDTIQRAEIEDENALTVATRDPDRLYLLLNEIVLTQDIELDVVTLADENVQSIYRYLAGREHH